MENEIETDDEVTSRKTGDEDRRQTHPKKIPSREIPIINVVDEKIANANAIDDLGKLGKPFSDALMQMQEMSISLSDDEDDPIAGEIDPSRPIHLEDMGFEFLEEGTDYSIFAFGCSVSGNVVTVTPGYWRTLAGNFTTTDPSVVLSGSTEYVYTYHNKDHSATGLGHSTTVPDSSGDLWICVLQKFTSTDATNWNASTIYHVGDVMLYGPTA
jgi:hypothetical protein